MRLPALVFGFCVLTILLAAAQVVPMPRTDEFDHAPGMVLGRDFSRLLRNPFLTLDIERSNGEVRFVWRSESESRLDEVQKLGVHIQEAKRRLEDAAPAGDHPGSRSASLP